MQRVEYDADIGEWSAIDLTPEEEAAHGARQETLQIEWAQASAGERQRADDLATIAESADLPQAVRDALARLVN